MGANYQPYQEYKDSGYAWIGKIPKHWMFTELKRYSSVQGGYAFSSDSFLDSGKAVIRIGDITQNGSVSLDSCKYIKKEDSDQYGQYEVHSGDLLMAMTGATIGKAGWYKEKEPALLNQRVGSFKCNGKHLNYNFFWYVLNSAGYQEYITLTAFGGAQPNISDAGMVGYQSAFPLVEEQQKIASFLDHETAQIGTLIEKQQQLITLLKEKRQAVISHAVTKGLNANAPMRDSGVEWLGEVPEHWVVTRLKYHINVFEQGWSPQCDSRPADNNEYGVLKVGCVNYGGFNKKENKALPKELKPQLQYLLVKGDLLISRANTKELVGSAAVVDGDYDNLILCDKLYRLRFDKIINTQLIAYYLALPVVRQQIELGATGASHSMQNIGQSTIKEMPVIIPPIDEADELVELINKKVEVFDLTLGKASEQILLLQERRTALISAAVTGKIDVRRFNIKDGNVA